MKKWFGLLGLLTLLAIVFVSTTSAGGDQTVTEINATYEVIPEDRIVHVSKEITFTNLDPDTRYWQGYYCTFNYYLPDGVKNIDAYDSTREMEFHRLDPMDRHYVFEFNEKVWYDKSYTFTIEYDIGIHKNTATFNVEENGNNTEVTITIPDEYETHIDRGDYSQEKLPDVNVFKFKRGQEWTRPHLVYAVNRTDMHALKGTAHLKDRDVEIKVNFWDGEDEWADEILNTATESLPVLEDISGLPYPVPYNITITQATINDTCGYGGSNDGKDGIILLHTEDHEILIHELSHYWTRACNFEQLWMDEGYADLYAYLVLNQTHPDDAYARKELFFNQYDTMKPSYDFPLSDWTVTESVGYENSGQVDYGYKKSFVLMYNIYEDVGLEVIQKTNHRFSNSNDGVSIDEYIVAIESASGKNLKNEWELVMPD